MGLIDRILDRIEPDWTNTDSNGHYHDFEVGEQIEVSKPEWLDIRYDEEYHQLEVPIADRVYLECTECGSRRRVYDMQTLRYVSLSAPEIRMSDAQRDAFIQFHGRSGFSAWSGLRADEHEVDDQ